MKLNWKEQTIIAEVKRRINEFKDGNKNASMVYLGWPSEVKTLVKKNVLTPYGKETKRALNWYNLTETGRQLI